MKNAPVDESEHSDPGAPKGRWKRRLIVGVVALAGVVLGWFVGAFVVPRWWAQRVGDLIDGRLTFGSILGLSTGFVLTAAGLVVLLLGVRFRKGWKRGLWFVLVAGIIMMPNFATLGIVMGSKDAAHAGERILDVDGPGFRGGSLVGAILGVVIVVAMYGLNSSRNRNRATVKDLRAAAKVTKE